MLQEASVGIVSIFAEKWCWRQSTLYCLVLQLKNITRKTIIFLEDLAHSFLSGSNFINDWFSLFALTIMKTKSN